MACVSALRPLSAASVRGRMFSLVWMPELAWERGFRAPGALARRLLSPSRNLLSSLNGRAAMKSKVETLMLQSLFGACLLVCVMAVGGMLLG